MGCPREYTEIPPGVSDNLSEAIGRTFHAIMHRLRSSALIVTSLAILLAACGTAGEPTSTTTSTTGPGNSGVFAGADGVETDVSDPSRIVSLNGDITEILFELGVGNQVVGVDLTTTYPEVATQLPDVGLGRRFDAEAVIGLAPTLVIGDTQIGSEESIAKVRGAGVPVAIIEPTATLAGVERKIATIATIVDRESEGLALAERVNSEINEALALAENTSDTPDAAFVYVRGPETLLMFGNGMPTHFLITAANAVDVLGEAGVTFAQPLSAERLVASDPEVIITPTQGFEILGGLDSFLSLPGVADTRAGEQERIVTFDEALILGMGPRVGDALAQLVVALHPELATP